MELAMIMCPVEEMGTNSVSPSTIAITTVSKIVIRLVFGYPPPCPSLEGIYLVVIIKIVVKFENWYFIKKAMLRASL
jgi:hypothetical protein